MTCTWCHHAAYDPTIEQCTACGMTRAEIRRAIEVGPPRQPGDTRTVRRDGKRVSEILNRDMKWVPATVAAFRDLRKG